MKITHIRYWETVRCFWYCCGASDEHEDTWPLFPGHALFFLFIFNCGLCQRYLELHSLILKRRIFFSVFCSKLKKTSMGLLVSFIANIWKMSFMKKKSFLYEKKIIATFNRKNVTKKLWTIAITTIFELLKLHLLQWDACNSSFEANLSKSIFNRYFKSFSNVIITSIKRSKAKTKMSIFPNEHSKVRCCPDYRKSIVIISSK